MDKTLHNQMYGRLSFTPRTRQSSGSSMISVGRKSMISGPIGGFKKSSTNGRFSLSGRSNQSLQVIARSENNYLENYGHPMPVMVNEALTFSERSSSVSINCSQNGWAWAVSGRRLLIWQYKDSKLGSPKSEFVRTPQRRGTSAQCRELTLPHCDIGHKASLISVFVPDEQQMASCLAVSPTGDVRYWPSIAHDGSSIDSTGILDGQELDYMLNISPHGYILITTTCNLVLLQIQLQNGRHTIQHKSLKPPSGFFGGIGKKFASIIIGMNSGQDKENKFVKIVKEVVEDGNWIITVLADKWLQRWLFSSSGTEQFLFEDHDLYRKIRDEFQQKFWSGRDSTEIELSLLDMQNDCSKLYVLCGSVNETHTPQMYYGICVIEEENDSMKIAEFIPLKLTLFYSVGNENECLKMRFIINRGTCYLYSERTIYPTTISQDYNDGDLEKIELPPREDKILNAGVFGHIPLFFTKTYGLICISPTDFDGGDFLNQSSYSVDLHLTQQPQILSESFNQTISNSANHSMGNLTMYELDPDQIFNTYKDEVSQMKAAFIYHLKRNKQKCNSILLELLATKENNIEQGQLDSSLDKIILSIATDLAEDLPAADPRWEQDISWAQNKSAACLGSSASLQIITQLREKNLAMSHFIEFLHTTELWKRLEAVTYRGTLKSTCQLLSDLNEKIIGAIALKTSQNCYTNLIDEAIQLVVRDWNQNPVGTLVHQDLFYVKLTRFQDIFQGFRAVAEDLIENQVSYQAAETISKINTIILQILSDIINFRNHKSQIYALAAEKQNKFEYLPWTATSGKSGAKDVLAYFIEITLKNGARATGEPEVKQRLYQQLVELIDFVLDGRKNYLDSVKDSEKYGVLLQQYDSQRRDLIYPLVEDSQYELAAKLAEKYLDFQILILICDRTENQDRLNHYIERYKEYNFSQFAINWHLRQNKQGDLFERFKDNQNALSEFLGDHPSLAWIQLMFNGDFARAANILFQLAKDEEEYIARKKTMLSLAKLSFLAVDADMTIQIDEINAELNLIDYQEQIPENILSAFGYNVDNQNVLKPEEIINLYISDENESATEFEFLKALELLNYVEDPFEIRHKIWCSAILKDTWIDYDMNLPLDYMQNMMFFKLIDLCYLIDDDLENFLPPQENFLNSLDLGNLPSNPSFQYLLKLGYEHISDSYKKKDSITD